MTKPNPDDRSNNVERLQTAIENTRENIREANETLEFSSQRLTTLPFKQKMKEE